jgi:pilus assembly protein CpaE
MISLFSPKGGVGRTTLAFNLAVALAADHRVCLIDGSLQFSDLRGLLRAPAAAPSIMNLPTDKIRDTDLAEVVWTDPSGIDVLLAPPRIEMAEMVTVRDIEKAVSIIRQVYEVIVVDTRAALSDDVLAFLDGSDLILEVLAYDSMAIRALAMADEAFATIGYSPSKLEAVLNRSDSTGGFTKADVEEALNRTIEHEVVSDGKLVIAANNEGVPFVLANPDAPVSQGVRTMAASIAARLPGRVAALARR